MTPKQIISEYSDAYKAVSGKGVQVNYFRGWYSVYSNNFQSKYRKVDILRMTDTLRGRLIND